MERPTVEEVRRAFRYEPETGKLYWRWRDDVADHVNRRFAGKEAFTAMTKGYRIGIFRGLTYTAQMIIRVIVNGEWPKGKMPRFNDDKGDNRVSDNVSKRAYRNNRSGHIGVALHKKTNRWCAYVSKDGKQIKLGYFERLEDAVAARRAAE